MIHMHYFVLCFTKFRGFAGVLLWLGDYHYPYLQAAREEFFSETGFPVYPVLGNSRWFRGFREKEDQSY
jgi:hypothetical protein